MNMKNLNFVPMGFETLELIRNHTPVWFELCPYGIWNNQPFQLLFCLCLIWTLSLWDLKQFDFPAVPKSPTFELCPYGIWNK